jgi:hypothetical protein
MMEAIRSSGTFVLTRATHCNIPEDCIINGSVLKTSQTTGDFVFLRQQVLGRYALLCSSAARRNVVACCTKVHSQSCANP